MRGEYQGGDQGRTRGEYQGGDQDRTQGEYQVPGTRDPPTTWRENWRDATTQGEYCGEEQGRMRGEYQGRDQGRSEVSTRAGTRAERKVSTRVGTRAEHEVSTRVGTFNLKTNLYDISTTYIFIRPLPSL